MQVIDSMGQLTSLTSLRIVDCRLAELSSSISRLQNLRDLDLDCSFFPEVHSCRLQNCQDFTSADLIAQVSAVCIRSDCS